MIIPGIIIGLISSIVTEVLKLFPALSTQDNRKGIVALVVGFVLSLIYLLTQRWSELTPSLVGTILFTALSSSFIIYKAVVTPIKDVISGLRFRLHKKLTGSQLPQ